MVTLGTWSLFRVARAFLLGVASANPLVAPLAGQLGYRSNRLLITKGAYTATTTSGSYSFAASLGGGTVTFLGHATWVNGSKWGPQQLFDNKTTAYDWCNATGASPLFGQFTFPRSVTVSTIFLVPRSTADDFPTAVTLIVDGTTIGTYSPTTISQADGLGIAYSGNGYKITPNISGTTWKLAFDNDSYAFIGELEFWGH